MVVSIPLHLDLLPGRPRAADLEAALAAHYQGSRHVRVAAAAAKLDPQQLNGSNDMQLAVTARGEHAVLTATLDNLGKGASGAAVQNLELMLGLD